MVVAIVYSGRYDQHIVVLQPWCLNFMWFLYFFGMLMCHWWVLWFKLVFIIHILASSIYHIISIALLKHRSVRDKKGRTYKEIWIKWAIKRFKHPTKSHHFSLPPSPSLLSLSHTCTPLLFLISLDHIIVRLYFLSRILRTLLTFMNVIG